MGALQRVLNKRLRAHRLPQLEVGGEYVRETAPPPCAARGYLLSAPDETLEDGATAAPQTIILGPNSPHDKQKAHAKKRSAQLTASTGAAAKTVA